MTCKHYDKEFMCCKLYSDWSMGMPEFASCTIPCKDYSTFTNYERIRNMSIDELAEIISSVFNNVSDNVITKWFDKNYCDKCSLDEDLVPCDYDGCPYQNTDREMIRLWLESEVQENA